MDITALRRLLALDAALERDTKALKLVCASMHECASSNALVQLVSDTASRYGLQADWRKADRNLAWLQANGCSVVTFADSIYPQQLREIPVPPIYLMAKGNVRLLERAALSVVGSRRSSAPGRRFAHDIAAQFSAAGGVVVSGLALGIDAAAHRGALANGGNTIAVLGCGLDVCYPRRHQALTAEISTVGLVVSEFPLGTRPLKFNFPRRNRIISGLSRGVLVVEAARRSGSISTAFHALEQGREVFAVPGNVGNPMNAGCHALIKQGAKLTEGLADVVEELPEFAAVGEAADASHQSATDDSATVAQSVAEPVLRVCGWSKFTVDEVVARSGLTVQEVSSMLLALELEGRVEMLANGMYSRIR